MRAICRDNKIDDHTGRRWKKQREDLNSMAIRRTRCISKMLGRPSKISKSTCKMLENPARNPVRKQPYEVMIEHFQLPVRKRQLQRKLREHTKGGRRYKCAFVKKTVSVKNRQERTGSGWQHQDKTVEDFWAFKVFTDEAHIDPGSQAVGDVLREQGKRYDTENIEERQPRQGSKFHIAAAISWWGKSKLEFYNDEEDHEETPPVTDLLAPSPWSVRALPLAGLPLVGSPLTWSI